MASVFVLKDAHLRLLEAMSWAWSDEGRWGAPAVDGKRPFGFSSGLEGDVADLVGEPPAGEDDDGDPVLSEEQEAAMRDLYGETLTALRVILSARSCRPGRYAADEDGTWRWVRR